jgi:hypothetical protein
MFVWTEVHPRPGEHGGRARVLVALLVALSAWVSCAVPQDDAPAPSAFLPPEKVAERLAARFHVDPASIVVYPKIQESLRFQVRNATLSTHDPPLYVGLEATSGAIQEVAYMWPGAHSGGLMRVPKGAVRTPSLDQAAAERLALAALRSCVGDLPDTYQLAEAGFHDSHANIYYRFRWDEIVDGVRLPHRATVWVDASRSRVASLFHLVWPVTVSTKPRVTREEAIEKALKWCRPLLRTGETLATPEPVLQVDFAHSMKQPGAQYLMWSMKVFTEGPTAREVVWLEVDAASGEVVGQLWPGGGPPPSGPRGQGPPESPVTGRRAVLVLAACAVVLLGAGLVWVGWRRRRRRAG